MDYSLPGSSIHGIFQARILESVAMSFSRRSSQPRDWTRVCCIAGGFLVHQGSPRIVEWVAFPSPGELPDPGIEWGLLHCRQILYQLSFQRSPIVLFVCLFFFLNEGYFHFVTHSRKGLNVLKKKNTKFVFIQGKEFYITEWRDD